MRYLDLFPDAQEVSLLFAQYDDTVFVFEVFKKHLDLLADLQRVRVLELVTIDGAFALEAHIENHRLIGDPQDTRFNDLPFLDVGKGILIHPEKLFVLLGGVLVLVEQVGADVHGSGARRNLLLGRFASPHGFRYCHAALLFVQVIVFGH